MMALRGLLLLVTIGVFIALWQGDRTNQARMLARHDVSIFDDSLPSCGYVESWRGLETTLPVRTCSAPGRSLTRFAPLHESRWFEPCVAGDLAPFEPASREAARELETIPLDEREMFVACEPPLPAGITPGEYRVVGSRGEMFPLELTSEEIAYHGLASGGAARDLYEVEQEHCRWYFIRVERSGSATVAAEEPGGLPAVAERPASITTIDWRGLVAELPAAWRCDLQRAACCSEEICNRWSRELAALFRQGNAWAAEMTETLRHSLERIHRAERISESMEGGPRL